MIPASLFVAASIVTLVHFGRVRRLRALPLAALFALLGLARSLPDGSGAQFWADVAAAACGLTHLVLLVPRHAPEPGSEDSRARQAS